MLLLLLPCCNLIAQNNLREGYVITLQGDTLRGDLDFRTAAMNSKQCVFRQNGTSSFVTYQPGEIQGYRYLNNGIYYVSKQFTNHNDSTMMVFAEFIIRGNLNLYQVGEDEMVIEDEEGNLASYSWIRAQRAVKMKERQNEMKGVLGMITKSQKATNILWGRQKSRENTKEAVMTYIDDVCVDGRCEVFEYKEKNTPKEDRMLHPWIKAGFKVTSFQFWNDDNMTSYAPQFSAGLDFHLNRIFNGFYASVGASYENVSVSRDKNELFKGEPGPKLNGKKISSIDFSQFDLTFGPGYQFKAGPVMAHAKLGGILRLASSDFNFVETVYYYRGNQYENMTDRDKVTYNYDVQFGLYAGCGIEYPLKKCAIICDLEYIYDNNRWTKSMDFDEEKTILKQHGICLSAGVKF